MMKIDSFNANFNSISFLYRDAQFYLIEETEHQLKNHQHYESNW